MLHIVWLHDRKIASYKHPFENSKEVDFMYHQGMLIVAQEFSFKFVQLSSEDASSKLTNYVDPDEINAPLAEKVASGLISEEKILGFVCDSLNKQLVLCTLNESTKSINFKSVRADANAKIVLEAKPSVISKKLDKKSLKAVLTAEEHIQVLASVRNGNFQVLGVRKNSIIEVYSNFELVHVVQIYSK